MSPRSSASSIIWCAPCRGNGRLIVNAEDARLAEVLAMGCWTPVETFGIDAGDWRARLIEADGSAFAVSHRGRETRRGALDSAAAATT